ncbi:hypothetical protein FWH58_00955 [Candidatus Saccharibacteria bacterium]|nr:hypothetical protein [Candidatus Saccharibacteria bacterium]
MQDDKGAVNNLPKQTKSSAGNLDIRWTASEAIEYEHSSRWYMAAVAVVLVIIGFNLWLQGINFGSISFAILILVIFAAVLLVVRRPARELHYVLTDEGLTVENQLHPFSEFRAFGVRRDGAMWQLVLIPVQRFSFSLTVFIHDDQGEAIVDALGARLSMEEIKTDWLDRLVNKLKI